ncbi:MAG: PAAR domain-containing protein [Bryobacterales bacterium]|nr:PAAR domain-containing protein [Bryobacteraceae bacterium]MDW8129670.1 PAAR domain-containing protein [Bryobacterales bacterium]
MKPAARVTDAHTCPMSSGTVPHVGGPVLPPCAPQVLVGGLPQARISDLATCAGPPDVIAQGAATVLVQGLPAARQGDATAHGGAIVTGLSSVLIGGPTFTARAVRPELRLRWGWPPWEWRLTYGESIEIRPDPLDPSFQSRALAALIRLDLTRTMHSALDAIEASGHRVIVENYRPGPGDPPFNAFCVAHDIVAAQDPERGSDSTVVWNPDVHSMGGPPGTVANWQQPGADVILGHELIHSAHCATGTHGDNWRNGVAVNEERNTVGLPPQVYNHPNDQSNYNGTQLPDTTGQPYTENQLRQEYRERGINSPVTGSPPEPRPSYYPGPNPVF